MQVTVNKCRSYDEDFKPDGWFFTVRPSPVDRRAVVFEVTNEEFHRFRGRFKNVLQARLVNAKVTLKQALHA